MSYMRRTRWESRLLAVEVVSALGEALGAARGRVAGGGYRRVPADTLLSTMGVKWAE